MSEARKCTQTFKLNNGRQMPAVGLGSWQDDQKALEESIIFALKNGYRLIDTANYYGIESVVGRAVRNSGVPRSEITIVTKFWGNYHHDVAAALELSLKELSLDYIDVFLMHWPWAMTPKGEPLRIHESPTFVETWKQMEKLVGDKCKGIGVCNFTQKTLGVLLEHATIVPAVNQVELHALNPCLKLVPYCQSKGIHVMGWGTLGGDSKAAKEHILEGDIFTSIARKHDCSTGTVSLSWAVQRGTTVIPKSSSKTRVIENIKLISLDDEDMVKMNDAHTQIELHRICNIHHLLWIELDNRRTLQGWTEVDFGWEDERGNWLT
ncbi:putative aldo-keto reductase [Aspergillus pseudotamarii]|uniref:D-xylose reductase [NAD(P)H] n=1 Tax=Aspergillus pseudotamarii TaxID=132259 RepID=A0A5N6TBR1_ASPPS|nr:putative aldo-keto reductase [Aspergillus pseudotamarii]KAE8143818.1 putative aldo-keto reductase [Aspergillus pseudotamarii]